MIRLKKHLRVMSIFVYLFSSFLFAQDISIVNYLKNPMQMKLKTFQSEDDITQNIIRLQNKNYGSTYSIRWGDLNKQKLYIVSLYPELGKEIQGKQIKKITLNKFIEKNIQLLLNPRCTVGTWYNKDNNKTYIDVSAVFFNKQIAIKLAKKYNQIAIWDLKNQVQINTGGDGKAIKNLPDIQNRIPKINYN